MSTDLKQWIEERLVEPEDIDLNDLADMDTEWDPKAKDGPFVRILGWGDVIKFHKKFYGVVQLKRNARIARKYGHFNLCVELNAEDAKLLYE